VNMPRSSTGSSIRLCLAASPSSVNTGATIRAILIRVRLDIAVPGREIVVGRDSKPGRSHEHVSVAIRDAFDAARRQIEDHARIHRGEVKLHSLPDYGRIIRLFPKDNYGFIATADSGELYFHRNSVVGVAFDRLAIGDEGVSSRSIPKALRAPDVRQKFRQILCGAPLQHSARG
jgi:hypothetical protein